MTVHVMGPKDDGRGLGPDERACPAGDLRGVAVVYHGESVLLSDGSWVCAACGATAGPTPEWSATVH